MRCNSLHFHFKWSNILYTLLEKEEEKLHFRLDHMAALTLGLPMILLRSQGEKCVSLPTEVL